MGVINITPDSFSDGSQFNSKNSFKLQFEKLLTWANIIDIGAESTAPFNSKISSEEELLRFQKTLFIYMKENEDPKVTLSIDTYKIETFRTVAKEIRAFWPKSNIIFNDISGCIDEKLLNLLSSFDIPFKYIFSHNLAPTRAESALHMSFVSESHSVVEDCALFFADGLKRLEGFEDRVFIDPCFGFSKSRGQNHQLLANLSKVLDNIPEEIVCVYGISRKSFLRFPQELDHKSEEGKRFLDSLQTLFFQNLLNENKKRSFVLRVHDESSLKALNTFKSILESSDDL